MSEVVKTQRRYDSRRRREQAEETRRDIVAAAGVLFRERGYAGTSMPAVAASAGVAVETVYRAVGSKAGLFRAVVEAALAGGTARAEVPVEQRPAIRAVIDEPDPRRKLVLYAATQPGIHRRTGPLLRGLAEGAANDVELRTLSGELEARRHAGQGRLVAELAERGALREGLPVDEAADVVWTLCSHAVYELLVGQRGWSAERYRDWLAAALARELLPEPDGRGSVTPGR
jgi:AcrR family transcriptional regulator